MTVGNKYLANNFLFEFYQKKKLKNFLIIRNNFLCTILFFQREFKNICFDTLKYQASHDYREMHEIFKKKPFIYKLKKIHLLEAENILRKFKIKLKKNLVTIHARDKSYKKHDGESYRNSNIENFKKSVMWLLKKNYQVIRLGNQEMIKCSYSNKIIDITKINFGKKKELIDFYFIQKCKFLIGSASGPYIMAASFNKPMLLVDMAPLGNVLPMAQKGLSMPKIYFNLLNKKKMSFEETLNNRASHLRLDVKFKKNKIKLINNTSNEIYNSTREIFKKVKNNNFKEDLLQKKFKKLLLSHKVDSAKASTSISSSFIKKYRKLLN